MEPIEDINGFSNLVYIEHRNFEGLKNRMITEIRVPATIVDMGLKSGGFPYCILRITRQERASGPKKSEPGQVVQDKA